MQKIFYNGKIAVFSEKLEYAEAFLVNDENIVLVGKNDEVLEMNNEETEVIDLLGKTVVPTFFDTNAKVFSLIEDRLRQTNRQDFIEDLTEIDENYDKFQNYSVYKEEFLNIQSEYIQKGITTILEFGVTNKEFIFWKKISENNDLKIDVIAYIDMISSKEVMDNNCRSYRKYKNHFRIGGYLIKVDGNLSEKKAYLSKKYRGEKTYKGYSYVHDEQLSFLIKTALSEKKQVVAEVNGDEALNQFLRCLEENVVEKNEEERLRPIAKNCNLISKKQTQKMKDLNVSPSFEIDNLYEFGKKYLKVLGMLRSKNIQPIKNFVGENMPFLINSFSNEAQNIFKLISYSVKRNSKNGKIIAKNQQISFENALFSMIKYSSKLAFDDIFKGNIENGYRATFIVLAKSLNDLALNFNQDYVESVYVDGTKIK